MEFRFQQAIGRSVLRGRTNGIPAHRGSGVLSDEESDDDPAPHSADAYRGWLDGGTLPRIRM